MVNKKGKYMYY